MFLFLSFAKFFLTAKLIEQCDFAFCASSNMQSNTNKRSVTDEEDFFDFDALLELESYSSNYVHKKPRVQTVEEIERFVTDQCGQLSECSCNDANYSAYVSNGDESMLNFNINEIYDYVITNDKESCETVTEDTSQQIDSYNPNTISSDIQSAVTADVIVAVTLNTLSSVAEKQTCTNDHAGQYTDAELCCCTVERQTKFMDKILKYQKKYELFLLNPANVRVRSDLKQSIYCVSPSCFKGYIDEYTEHRKNFSKQNKALRDSLCLLKQNLTKIDDPNYVVALTKSIDHFLIVWKTFLMLLPCFKSRRNKKECLKKIKTDELLRFVNNVPITEVLDCIADGVNKIKTSTDYKKQQRNATYSKFSMSFKGDFMKAIELLAEINEKKII